MKRYLFSNPNNDYGLYNQIYYPMNLKPFDFLFLCCSLNTILLIPSNDDSIGVVLWCLTMQNYNCLRTQQTFTALFLQKYRYFWFASRSRSCNTVHLFRNRETSPVPSSRECRFLSSLCGMQWEKRALTSILIIRWITTAYRLHSISLALARQKLSFEPAKAILWACKSLAFAL